MKRLVWLLCVGAASLTAQVPRVGIIDFYGVRKVPLEKLRAALGFQAGDRMPSSKGDVEERLEKVPGVVRANLEAVCCENGKAILYVGIEEKGAISFELRDPPESAVLLPPEIHSAYHRFVDLLGEAVRKGEVREDLSRGHSLIEYPPARAVQEEFVGLAGKYLPQLRETLRQSADEEARAVAAYVIGYAPNKRDIVDDLQYAMRDPDATVRANAMRALSAVIVYAAGNPDAEIRAPLTWFVEMLNSLYWTDRHSAAVALATFTEKRDPNLMAHLRERALPALVEMARWQHLPHALPAFMILGRVAGLEEKQIQDAWNRNEREAMIKACLAKLRNTSSDPLIPRK